MSIQSEITRLSDNVATALSAISNKGVTVPSDAKSDDLAALIESIQVGSSAPIPTAGDTPVLINLSSFIADRSETLMASGVSIIVPVAGTYRFKTIARNAYSSSGSWGKYYSKVRFFQNDIATGEEHTLEGNYFGTIYEDIACNAGDKIEIWSSSSDSTYKTAVSCLITCINWNNGFQGG